jgi:sporulation protein, YlmC/YmxH family
LKFNSLIENEDLKLARKRLSEIGGQEIINLFDGGKLGVIADIDLLINDDTGSIESLLIPDNKRMFSFRSDRNYIEVPWKSVKKIGYDTVIVELDNTNGKRFGF